MIRPLRQRHRYVMTVLGIVLPLTFAIGLAARRPVPAGAATVARFESLEWQRRDLFATSPVQVQLRRERAGSGRFALDFKATGNFVKPDLMVYWVAGQPQITGTLPQDALLLGAFNAGTDLLLPDEVINTSGVLVLYSLADNQVVEVSHPIAHLIQ